MMSMSEVTSYTQQELFNLVCHKALKMKEQCETNNTCMYRSADGKNACFVGQLLEDHEVPRISDGTPYIGSVLMLERSDQLPARLVPHVDMLQFFQGVHDDSSNWDSTGLNSDGIEEIRQYAITHDYDYSILPKDD